MSNDESLPSGRLPTETVIIQRSFGQELARLSKNPKALGLAIAIMATAEEAVRNGSGFEVVFRGFMHLLRGMY